jgi:hypothetical protein
MLILFVVVKVLNFLELNKSTLSPQICPIFLSYSSWGFAQIFGAKCVNLPTVYEYSAAVYISDCLVMCVSAHSPIFACCHIARLVYNYRRLKPVID